ncbi:hypothetical protein [uncultured Methylobacterium sp.]|uniref:hypothetical protein n=1 Tax=uncultured Methylobacterium sp. TaxID=157278 RepID=UPI0035C9B0F2
MNSFIPTPDADRNALGVRYTRSTASGRIARTRRENAGRQRLVRERRREAGEPDPGLLDRAIVDALRSILLRCEDSVSRPIDPKLVLHLTREHLVLRATRAKDADPDAPPYNGAAVAEALRRRLFEKPKRPLHTR